MHPGKCNIAYISPCSHLILTIQHIKRPALGLKIPKTYMYDYIDKYLEITGTANSSAEVKHN
jgi:hypothetical protein